jgi:glycosyltransferase involved in cell wall biosynthesis
LVTAEAMMRGTPAIVSDQGASKEIVADGRTGVVVPADDVNSLAAALTGFAADRDRVLAMGKAARAAAVELYSEDRWIASYLDIYDKLLAEYGRETA